ncbi:GDSL-type esterase/lipase family protein [Pedobacter jamesrossensis]|uniref:GDSL-type esterase/lipase family protein n=1 Tax=Pedobacter jamesrossensis TaxID=1908238 RepID=A0ABV8NUR8_9SPHI
MVDKAKGGRSTRTFFEEGRWNLLEKNDLVLIQFGHNDAAKDKPERYVDIPEYKNFLRMYVKESRSKKAISILITPVMHNYPWKNGVLGSAYGDYPQAVNDVDKELKVPVIDLTKLSTMFHSKRQRFCIEKLFYESRFWQIRSISERAKR